MVHFTIGGDRVKTGITAFVLSVLMGDPALGQGAAFPTGAVLGKLN